MADETSGKSLTQAATELGLQIPETIDVPYATADEAAYQMMLYRLSRLTGQSEATIDAYVKRHRAQWVSKPEPAPDWRTVESEIIRRVSLGEHIDWYGAKPDLPLFR